MIQPPDVCVLFRAFHEDNMEPVRRNRWHAVEAVRSQPHWRLIIRSRYPKVRALVGFRVINYPAISSPIERRYISVAFERELSLINPHTHQRIAPQRDQRFSVRGNNQTEIVLLIIGYILNLATWISKLPYLQRHLALVLCGYQ